MYGEAVEVVDPIGECNLKDVKPVINFWIVCASTKEKGKKTDFSLKPVSGLALRFCFVKECKDVLMNMQSSTNKMETFLKARRS